MNGYPTDSDVDQFLSDRGIALDISENNTDWYAGFKAFIWSIMNRFDFAGALAVFLPSATTFNVAGGSYKYQGSTKTYTPGTAIDPVDNDTTYIWMETDNTVGYGIDGDGWPAGNHIKLAEIDVASDGTITDVRDLRGQLIMDFGS